MVKVLDKGAREELHVFVPAILGTPWQFELLLRAIEQTLLPLVPSMQIRSLSNTRTGNASYATTAMIVGSPSPILNVDGAHLPGFLCDQPCWLVLVLVYS